ATRDPPPIAAIISKRELSPVVANADASGSYDTPPTGELAAANHDFVSSEARKKLSSIVPTLVRPDVAGCVPSGPESVCCQVNPSERGVVPLAQRYGPQAIHGAALL